VQETVHGLDITVLEVLAPEDGEVHYQVPGEFTVDFDNSNRSLPALKPLPKAGKDLWILKHNTNYVIVYNEYIKIPSLYCGIVLPRSTLLRGGATLYSALWDSGYEGRGQGTISVGPVDLVLHKNARVGQMIFLKADTERQYEGTYNRERARIWTDGGVSKKGVQCSYMVEGSDGVVVFPLPKGTTNNQAEYMGVIKALKQNKSSHIEIITDSLLLCNQVKTALGVAEEDEVYNCKSKNLKPLLERVVELCEGRKVTFMWMSRDHNKAHAD
jgi:deoxycytidine triphosphate deaminase/ribonuclease HI